jgi:hypothetical protein
MAGPGNTIPKPEDQRRRRNPTLAMTKLPARARRGRPPVWPLSVEPSAEERRLWAKLWRTPPAAVWEQHEWPRTVARYVLVVVRAEESLSIPLLAEARQLEDRLGLNPLSMLRLRWEVTDDEVAGQRESTRASRYVGLTVADLG